MSKKLWFLTLDSETATLPFASTVAKNAEQKKNIAIAKPLIYDIAWVIHDRAGVIRSTRQFLIAETFAIPSVFDTAYYREKRPLYIEMLNRGETSIKPWGEVVDILVNDLEGIDYVCAYNARFDFKKAIPYTDLYISKIYSDRYKEWEEGQYKSCVSIVNGIKPKGIERETEHDKKHFLFRGKDYKLIDVWGVSCETLINNYTYKKKCIDNGMISPSGEFFKTSAESSYRYLVNKYGFIEDHTALSDAIIETFIIAKAAKKGKLIEGILDFPFQKLGKTTDFLYEHEKKLKPQHFKTVRDLMGIRLEQEEEKENWSNWAEGFLNRFLRLEEKLKEIEEREKEREAKKKK